MNPITGNYQGIIDLIQEIKRCEECKATMAAIAMSYISIDLMGSLTRPAKSLHRR